jgi:hypothetical protein
MSGVNGNAGKGEGLPEAGLEAVRAVLATAVPYVPEDERDSEARDDTADDDSAGMDSGADDAADDETPAARKPKGGRKARKPRPSDGADPSAALDAGGFDMDAMNGEWAVVLMGSKAVILREQEDAPIEDRMRIISLEAFRAWHLNRFTQRRDKDGEIKIMTHATAWLHDKRRRQYAGIEFAPGDGAPVTGGYYNLWRGFSVMAREGGSFAIFRDHLWTNVAHGDKVLFNWIMAWFAHIIQRPRERIGTALVLRGAMGSGKSKVGEVFGSLIQSHYFMVDDPRYVTGQFNAHMASCLLLQAEEAVWAGDKAAEGRLKGLVTSKFQMIEQKGIDPIRLDNFVRLIMTSNEDWVVPAGKDERRFCVLDVAPHVAQNHEYFRAMDEELNNGGREALLAHLLALDISGVNLRQIPLTGALLEQKVRSLDSVDGWWMQRLMDGAPTRGHAEWPVSVAKEVLFDDYIAYSDKIGIKRRSMESEMGMKLAKLMPTLRETRPYDEAVSRRRRHLLLPSLDEARAAFDAALNQPNDWPPAEGNTDNQL